MCSKVRLGQFDRESGRDRQSIHGRDGLSLIGIIGEPSIGIPRIFEDFGLRMRTGG